MPNQEAVIADLGLLCNFYIGYHATRTSLLCDQAATSVVIDTDDPRKAPNARCTEHEGMLDRERHGEMMSTLPATLVDAIVSAPNLNSIR